MVERGRQGLVVHDFEHNTSPERVKPQEVGYIYDGTCNSEVEAGLVDLQADLAPGSRSDVGFWLEQPKEGSEARHEGVYLLRRSEDGLSFEGGYIAATGESKEGEPEYASAPELFEDLPAEFVEDQLLSGPLEVGAKSTFFDGMIVAKIGVGGRMASNYDRARWGENPMWKIVYARQRARYTKS